MREHGVENWNSGGDDGGGGSGGGGEGEQGGGEAGDSAGADAAAEAAAEAEAAKRKTDELGRAWEDKEKVEEGRRRWAQMRPRIFNPDAWNRPPTPSASASSASSASSTSSALAAVRTLSGCAAAGASGGAGGRLILTRPGGAVRSGGGDEDGDGSYSQVYEWDMGDASLCRLFYSKTLLEVRLRT